MAGDAAGFSAFNVLCEALGGDEEQVRLQGYRCTNSKTNGMATRQLAKTKKQKLKKEGQLWCWTSPTVLAVDKRWMDNEHDEGDEEEEHQSVFNLVGRELGSAKLALRELNTVCLTLSSI